ncbi:MAG: IPT/TIG domain-containing protein, partial [Brevundimonas sp.]|uniref:IPT/TIG domain-containing protein n=1 Tax=Brevundimonas sp. TaxID=1871086 RepID=UPI00271FA261
MSVAGRGIALWLIGLCLILASALAPTGARAQALFPGGCPVVFDAFGGATVTYSFSAGSSGTFTDAGGAVCNGMGQPSPWRYRYTYTVTSTLVDATFRITSPHEGGVDITAPGTYEVTARVFPGNQWEARTYGAHPDDGAEPYDEDVFGPLNYPALGLGYSTTATGPNPSGTVTVTFRGLTTDVPGSRVVLSTTPGALLPAGIPNRGPLIAATGALRSGDRPFEIPINTAVTFGANLSLLLQTGATYGFAVNPYHGGLLHSVTCSAGSATIGADNASFTLTGQADRSQVNCTLAHAQRPTVTALSTATGPVAGGTVVTITGTNFTGVTAVRFGAAAATAFTVNSATQITATAPAGAGSTNVSAVIGSLASSDTAADDFTYVPAPTVTGLSPTSGARTGGTSVVVTGTDLTGATGVTFGGVAATA